MTNACKLGSLAVLIAVSISYHHSASAAAVLQAEYTFDHSLSSDIAGAPDLTAVDPQGASGFTTDTVSGSSRTVYNFQSNSTDPAQQAGLLFSNAGGLIPSDNYSVQMIFKLTERDSQWRRLLDSLNRQSDSGFYIDPSNRLDVFPTTATGVTYGTGTYVNVALTVSSDNTVNAYLNGELESSSTTDVMNIGSDNLLGFFLDNTAGGGSGEWSPGDIAVARIYSGVLTQDQINALNNVVSQTSDLPTGTPEPGSLGVVVSGLAGVTLLRWRRRIPIAA
jgi:hypothetical protein